MPALPPVLDERVETLLLGSFPGRTSLLASEYYANPQNQFWRLMGEVLQVDLIPLGPLARYRVLLAHRVGLWDVIAACRRQGSQDRNIQNPQSNDFSGLRKRAPRLIRVAFNGKKAAEAASEFTAAGYKVITLPSSSSAHARIGFESKLREWRRLTAPFPKENSLT